MNQRFKPSDEMKALVGKLHRLIQKEEVPDLDDDYYPADRLSSDARRMLHLFYQFELALARNKDSNGDCQLAPDEKKNPPNAAPNSAMKTSELTHTENMKVPEQDDAEDIQVQVEDVFTPKSEDTVVTSKETVSALNDAAPKSDSIVESQNLVVDASKVASGSYPVEGAHRNSSTEKDSDSDQASVDPVTVSSSSPTGNSLNINSSINPDESVKGVEAIKKVIYLKNSRVNEDYQSEIELDGLKECRLKDDGGSGLTFDEASGTFSGKPENSGDFLLKVIGIFNNKSCEVDCNLAVIPDPKSLWISIDSDENDPYWKPNEDFKMIDSELLCVAASKRGRSHAREGTFRDDDFGLLVDDSSGWFVSVVADGAGSAKLSRRGSKIAVESVLSELPSLLNENLSPHLDKLAQEYTEFDSASDQKIKTQLYMSLVSAAFNAAKAIDSEASDKGEETSSYSTTLIITVAKKISAGWFIASFSIGDGGAAVFDINDGSLKVLTLPDSGEYAGQTRFLHTSEFAGGFESISQRIFFDIRQEFTAIALMTDGISDPKFPTDSVFSDYDKWADFWVNDISKSIEFSRSNDLIKDQFLEWLDFWSPGNHDDRTIAILVP